MQSLEVKGFDRAKSRGRGTDPWGILTFRGKKGNRYLKYRVECQRAGEPDKRKTMERKEGT